MNPAYISALAALAGANIGGLTSFATSWLTQRTQLRHAHRDAERAELKTLYKTSSPRPRASMSSPDQQDRRHGRHHRIGGDLRNGRAYAAGFRSDSDRCGDAGREDYRRDLPGA